MRYYNMVKVVSRQSKEGYSCNSTYSCNQVKFNICKAKVSCMLTHVILLNSKDQHLARHATNELHLILISILSNQLKLSRNSLPLIPTGPTSKERLLTLLSLSHLQVQQQQGSFFQFFSSSCFQLKARVILALSLQEPVPRVRGKSNSFIYCLSEYEH